MSTERSRILVVDDSLDNLEFLSHLLEKRGYDVVCASNGTQGVHHAAEDQPDLILLDAIMPNMDGFETCRQLKTGEQTKDIPVIFMTALADTDDKVKGFECGAIDYLTKPIDPEELLVRVNTHLSMQKLYKNLTTEIQDLSAKQTEIAHQMDDLRLNLSRTLPHELRTPLNSILGFSRFLMSLDPEQYPASEKIFSLCSAIYQSALRLHHLIENYLLYADLQLMENNPGKRQREGWQSDEIIDTKPVIFACIMSKTEKVQRQNDLKVEMVDASVRISERSLHKIVDELLDNAFKFSKPGTPIHITTEVNGHQWMLKITDQGRGMTTEQIAQIGAYVQFERHRYEQQGSGLGLTIARLLTQLNGGELTITSVPQQGTTVTVVFECR